MREQTTSGLRQGPTRGWQWLAVLLDVALLRAGESLAETLGRGTTCTGCCAA